MNQGLAWWSKLDVLWWTNNLRIIDFFLQIRKSKNWTFKMNFLRQKSSKSFKFVLMKNNIVGPHFLYNYFLRNFNYKTNLSLKIMPNFWRSLALQISIFLNLSSGYQFIIGHLILATSPRFILSWKTEVRFASFLSDGFITAIVVNPPERKLAKRTSVYCRMYPNSVYFMQL